LAENTLAKISPFKLAVVWTAKIDLTQSQFIPATAMWENIQKYSKKTPNTVSHRLLYSLNRYNS